MTAIRNPRLSLLLVSLLVLTGCTTQMHSRVTADAIRQQDILGLPYHPFVYHVDLAILAYQLYGQTLVWPFDPYYEELSRRKADRDGFMKKVHAWTEAKGAEQVKVGAELGGYRGPGVLGGFENNKSHDPIVFRYNRLYPWSHTITNADGRWTEYQTPREITGQIRDVYMCYRETGRPEGSVVMEHVVSGGDASAAGARDVLLAFEGGTGDKGEKDQPPSQSLMGFVLLRYWPGQEDYDVHIAFRGSRSGAAGRAVWQSFSEQKASGNPDWITDLGYTTVSAETITTTGAVFRGFAQSMKSILPQLFRCLSEVAYLAPGGPKRIYVTGHSLGAALAQHFVSAVLLGNRYGPDGSGNGMPNELRLWPWKQIKLITFSAPRAGNAEWAKALTTRGLDSEFFSTDILRIDLDALAVLDPSILPRLIDQNRPAGYRVLFTTDPVTTEKVIGGKHVGKTVYVNEPGMLAALFEIPDVDGHEPVNVRDRMLANLVDPRIPATAWRYRGMRELNPEQDETQRGSAEEFVKLAAAIAKYYRENNLWFDQAAFARNKDEFMMIRQAK